MAAVTEAPRVLGLRAQKARRLKLIRWVLLFAFALIFAVPLVAMVEFSTRSLDLSGPRTLEYWRQIVDYPELTSAIFASLELAAITAVAALVLLVPTMVWVRLRLPKLARTVEFLCLLPLTIPAIVLVVGWAPVYLWINYFTPTQYQTSPLVLAFAYVVLVLPYMYRSLDAGLQAIDVPTLTEAARSLGAGWGTVMVRVITPNIASAVLNSSLLAVSGQRRNVDRGGLRVPAVRLRPADRVVVRGPTSPYRRRDRALPLGHAKVTSGTQEQKEN